MSSKCCRTLNPSTRKSNGHSNSFSFRPSFPNTQKLTKKKRKLLERKRKKFISCVQCNKKEDVKRILSNSFPRPLSTELIPNLCGRFSCFFSLFLFLSLPSTPVSSSLLFNVSLSPMNVFPFLVCFNK